MSLESIQNQESSIELQNLEQESQDIDLALENSSIEQESVEKSREELEKEQEEIQARIEEIQRERKERAIRVKKFIDEAINIIQNNNDIKDQINIMNNRKIFDLLPANTLKLIQENIDKYNFIDYKAAELLLEDDHMDKELEVLNERLLKNNNSLEEKNEEDDNIQVPKIESENLVDRGNDIFENFDDTSSALELEQTDSLSQEEVSVDDQNQDTGNSI